MPRKDAGRAAERKPAVEEKGQRPADFDRLPKRFKDYIIGMEHRLYAAQKLVEAQPDSLVWTEIYSMERGRRNLTSDARVRFQTPTGIIEVQLDSRRGNGGVAISSPDGRLFILSECSNEVGVKVGRL